MFKCKVKTIYLYPSFQETNVSFSISNISDTKLPNHKLIGTYGNRSFTIGQIDKSIKVGDLLRCDGLPYMSRPKTKKVIKCYTSDDNYQKRRSVTTLSDKYPGYTPFQLDSGYWVLRKNEHLSTKTKTKVKRSSLL